jgi:CheY-like chemotaxis protein
MVMNPKSKLKILLIEDDVADAQLIARELTRSGFAFRLERVEAEADLLREMETEMPDLILSDHGLPAFSGFKALEIVREKHPKLPFIFISGSNDQGMVADMYEAGATNYVFKRDIADLKSAVLEALETQEEEESTPAEPEAIPAQFELEMPLPPASERHPAFQPAIGRLTFCPECRQAWDNHGRLIQLDKYCGTHTEIVVIRQRCQDCGGASHS